MNKGNKVLVISGPYKGRKGIIIKEDYKPWNKSFYINLGGVGKISLWASRLRLVDK